MIVLPGLRFAVKCERSLGAAVKRLRYKPS